MHYTIHHCKKPHPATFLTNEHPISPALFSVADDVYISGYFSDYAVAAYHRGKVVGVFKYRCMSDYLKASGTAVAKKFRGRGIAEKLWNSAIRKVRPKVVYVTVVSDAGLRLVERLKQRWPKVRFDITDDRSDS